MSRNLVSADELTYDKASMLAFYANDDNRADKAKMKKILAKAITQELTERQRFCIIQYYIHGKKKQDIAKALSVNPATVTRHIQRGEKRLRHIAEYY